MTQVPAIDRVVVIHDYSAPEGGAGVLALGSVKALRKRGHKVTLVTGEAETEDLRDLGVEVVGLGSGGLLKVGKLTALKQGYHNAAAEKMLSDWIKENDTAGTVYHLHNWSQILSPSIFRALRKVGSRVIVTCHDFFNICPNGGFVHFNKSEVCELKPLGAGCLASQCDRRSALHKYWRLARTQHLNAIAGWADSDFTFTFIHEKMRQRFIEAGFTGKRLITVPNPAEAWSRSARIPAEENPGYLFVGRFGPDKGADLALEATKRAGVPLTVVGTGETLEDAKAYYPHAHFAGWCNREQILGYARTARALLMPSRTTEPFGLVAFEAAKSGLPVILSRAAYVADDFERLDMGLKIYVRDVDNFTNVIKRLSSSDDEIARMSRNAYDRAEEACHSMDSWIARFEALYADRVSQAGVRIPFEESV